MNTRKTSNILNQTTRQTSLTRIVSKDETKKLRLIIQGVKSYIHIKEDYLLPMRRLESETLSEWKHLAVSWKIQISRAQTP